MFARHGFGISAQQNVGAAAGHVRRNRDCSLASRLRDDFCFPLVLLRVQHLVRNARLFQQIGQVLGFLDRNRADQHRLARFVNLPQAERIAVVFLHNAVDHGFVFFPCRAVHDVGIFRAPQRAIRGNQRNVQFVDLVELGGFGFRRSGHAGKFFVHAEIILEGDRREGLVLAFDLHSLLGFDGLVQVRPTSGGRASRAR